LAAFVASSCRQSPICSAALALMTMSGPVILTRTPSIS
jgi:hypothetical protein